MRWYQTPVSTDIKSLVVRDVSVEIEPQFIEIVRVRVVIKFQRVNLDWKMVGVKVDKRWCWCTMPFYRYSVDGNVELENGRTWANITRALRVPNVMFQVERIGQQTTAGDIRPMHAWRFRGSHCMMKERLSNVTFYYQSAFSWVILFMLRIQLVCQ